MRKYFENYFNRIRENKGVDLARAIKKTVDDIVPNYITEFSYTEHVVGLLFGDVQSGKTSHMFGLMCAAADEGFGIFILLTTDNIMLQQQTFKRAEKDLCDFCVCDENDYIKFLNNNMRKPAVIVLKKNGNVLQQWKNNLSSTQFVVGNPLFVVDDEADAASLNTKVNKNQQSKINRCLEDIRLTTSSSIYLEVTGTPQSILLQSKKSMWKPYFIYYFKPGIGYLGGDFFFGEDENSHVILTDNTESAEILADDEFPENGLKQALMIYLITSAHIKLSGGEVCNFLIHPSFRTSEHAKFAEKIGTYINELNGAYEESETKESFLQIYNSLQQTKVDIVRFEEIYREIVTEIENDEINICILNSRVSYTENTQYEKGNNIIVGGNSLGRGVTFPKLQTIYYCRVAKNPQADTMWQHSRMFGYDRDPDLMRVFMPPKLFKLFSDINKTNENIIAQIEDKKNGNDIKVYYPTGLRPTRKNVLDNKTVKVYSGGVNYFPFYPTNKSVETLDNIMSTFDDGEYSVSLNVIKKIIQQTGSEENDWNESVFEGFINTFIAENSLSQGALIVRRNRDIGKGTGTLLSPNDRAIGDSIKDRVVLTMYKVTGSKGWNNQKIWIPNIKLPGNVVYYNGEK
ncbi:Z1 domain-containing protein [uncultured Gardnerella sp.]|uniref:Z1 domain-containing protein n=1 Tax=uncultured Gardnerella sp. TaxID=293424 RepID=UPI0026278490|nr:Z1 domain-containing protein [uncultured Gardnerella sp.]